MNTLPPPPPPPPLPPLPPGPLNRRGPRPLLLHLMLAALRCTTSFYALPFAWMRSSGGLPLWNVAEFQRIADALASGAAAKHPGTSRAAEPPFAAVVAGELAAADRALIAGIAAYRRHPYARALPDPPTVWAEGGSRLLDYADRGVPVLVVPSLINRASVLDLSAGEGGSFLRWLAASGARPMLLDWGWPDQAERRFTLTDYIAGRLARAARAAGAIAGERPVLAGYCMGGTMAVAAAAQRPDLFRALALLAAPWDFHAADAGAQGRQALATLPLLEPLFAFNGTLPVDAIQLLFASLDPFAIADKYRAFARLDPGSPRARKFVALEDWLNDGVPLAAPVARECFEDWYGNNEPACGRWRIAGLPVDPAGIDLPAFVAVPARDRIVPPESAVPLAERLPRAVLHRPAAGHIGMVAGSAARTVLWQPFRAWLAGLS